ncbi:serine/threonine protein kinase [Kineosporia sp. NBRC 101731]|uniref:serine/threonine protein kinase n=1 Tax=Kineosporia sp. NBRC 101731 TaxID=3032199 RepID=UPI0025551D50|nr:serine/threonine protein kinase [Kineosporia sp. NBRC 101731]
MQPLEASDPSSIGRYRITGRLGQGGMGRVYLGSTPGGRPVAVKVINTQFEENPDVLNRFRREVEILRTVRNAFVAALIDHNVTATPYWMATEYVPGPTLAAAIRDQGRLDADVTRGLFAALAEALVDIHAHGICHRDLKPQNIILSVTGPRLIDFGIARGEDQEGLTQTGMTVGTPGYTAPEALLGHEIGPAADIFALAATIAKAATGRAPYGGGSGFAVSRRSMSGEVDVTGVPDDLATLIRDCSNPDPAARPGAEEIVLRCRPETGLIENQRYQQIIAGARATPPPEPSRVTAPPPALGATRAYSAPSVPSASSATSASPAHGRRPWLVGTGLLAVVLGVALIGTWLVGGIGADADDKASGSPTSSAGPADVTPAGSEGPAGTLPPVQTLTGPDGNCLAAPGSLANGDLPTIQPCDGSELQQWTFTAENGLKTGNLCLDLGANEVQNGLTVQLWECNGTRAQIFEAVGDEVRNPWSGRCLTTTTNEPAAGDPLIMWDCSGGNLNQVWHLPG